MTVTERRREIRRIGKTGTREQLLEIADGNRSLISMVNMIFPPAIENGSYGEFVELCHRLRVLKSALIDEVKLSDASISDALEMNVCNHSYAKEQEIRNDIDNLMDEIKNHPEYNKDTVKRIVGWFIW